MEKSEIETIYRKYFHDVFLYIRALSENESLAEEIPGNIPEGNE